MPLSKKQVEAIQSTGIDWFGRPLKVDGDYGPKTRWWHWITSLSEQRQEVIELALGYHAANVGEDPNRPNRGKMVDLFMEPSGLKPGLSWCVGFVSHIYRKVGVTWPEYHVSAYSLINWAKRSGKLVDEPLPGDVEAFLYPKKPGDTQINGHARIVTSFDSTTGNSYGVDGNVTNCVRTGMRRPRPDRYFIRPDFEEVEQPQPVLPANMIFIDSLGDR